MSHLKALVSQVKTLAQSTASIKDVVVLFTQQNDIMFNLVIGKKNVQENKEHTFINLCKSDTNGLSVIQSGTNTTSNFFTSYSSSKDAKYFAKLQSIENPENKIQTNTILEIYTNNVNPYLVHSINLSKHHAEVMNNDIVGRPLIWNQNQDKLIYVANQKPKEQENYFQVDLNFKEDCKSANTYQEYQQDWGECLNDVVNTSLYMFDLNQVELYQVQVTNKNLFYAYPQFDLQDGIIFCGYAANEFKYGILHCFNRDAKIYRSVNPTLVKVYPKPLTKEDQSQQLSEAEIISEDECSFRPILNHSRKQLYYFGSELKHQHCFYLAGKIIDLESKTITQIVPIIQENLVIDVRKDFDARNKIFNGKCGYYDDLVSSTWLKDDKHLIFNSISAAQKSIFVVNTESKEVMKISQIDNKFCTTASILKYDPESDTLFALFEGIGRPQQLGVLLHVSEHLGQPGPFKDKKMEWQFLNVNQDGFEQDLQEQFFYSNQAEGTLWSLKNRQFNDDQRPLIVMLHGGPHGATISQYTITRDILLQKGYAILAPNFTGSVGYGQQFIDRLATNVGKVDVEEILDMMKQVREKRMCHPTKAIVIGGSYGGYLSGILGSRHGEQFNAAVLMNPVLNLPFSANITDIPDWNLSVVLNQHKNWNLTADDYKKMFEVSPMTNTMTVPTLLLLGAKDRRVPYQSGLAFHAKQLFNGQSIQTYIYPKSDHSLADSLHTILDVVVKTIQFIEEKFVRKF